MYIPGLFLTASKPLRTFILEESYEFFSLLLGVAFAAFFGIQYYKSITELNLIFSGFFIEEMIF